MDKLSIIIVNWNTRELLRNCLRSIVDAAEGLDLEVIVSDNGSTDGSLEMCRNSFPGVLFIENGTNLGFAAANNRGLEAARGTYCLLLNSDTIVQPGTLSTCLQWMESHPETGGVGCRLRTASGGVQHSVESLSGFAASLRHHLGLSPLPHKQNHYYDLPHTNVDYVSGAFLMLRRSALERCGLLDEQFFMYAEEADLCLRLRNKGYRIDYIPGAEIVHLGGGSATCDHRRNVQRVVSRLRLLRKHHHPLYYQTFRGLSMARLTVRFLCGRLRFDSFRLYFKAHRHLVYPS